MREIKFRAWIKSLKILRRVHMLVMGNLLSITLYGEKEGEYQRRFRMSDCKIQQYTGLKDKNGREIFEGDILFSEIDDGEITECFEMIVFADGAFRRVDINYAKNWEDYKKIYPNEEAIMEKDYAEEMEIIGNVWENPEYLGPDK